MNQNIWSEYHLFNYVCTPFCTLDEEDTRPTHAFFVNDHVFGVKATKLDNSEGGE